MMIGARAGSTLCPNFLRMTIRSHPHGPRWIQDSRRCSAALRIAPIKYHAFVGPLQFRATTSMKLPKFLFLIAVMFMLVSQPQPAEADPNKYKQWFPQVGAEDLQFVPFAFWKENERPKQGWLIFKQVLIKQKLFGFGVEPGDYSLVPMRLLISEPIGKGGVTIYDEDFFCISTCLARKTVQKTVDGVTRASFQCSFETTAASSAVYAANEFDVGDYYKQSLDVHINRVPDQGYTGEWVFFIDAVGVDREKWYKYFSLENGSFEIQPWVQQQPSTFTYSLLPR
jgi:hypothetical protein